MINCQPQLHVYLKYFSRFMTTTLRVLLGFLLCCSCTQDVSVGPQSHLPYLSFCIRSYMCCYNYVACNIQNKYIYCTKSTAYTKKPKKNKELLYHWNAIKLMCFVTPWYIKPSTIRSKTRHIGKKKPKHLNIHLCEWKVPIRTETN